MKKQRTRILAVVLLVCTIVFGGCGTQDSFMSAVKSEDYLKAVELYEKKIAGNSREETEAQDALENYLDSAWTAYADGTMSPKKFRAVYRCLTEINDRLWILPQVPWMAYEYEMVDASKTSYSNGTAYANSGDYAAAMLAFAEVIPEDTENYEKAVKAEIKARSDYLESVIREATALADAGLYDEALALIEDAEYVIGYCEELEALRIEIVTRRVSEALGKAYREGDLLEVIRLYEGAVDEPDVEISFEMTQMYSESKSSYLRSVADAARAAFENGRNYQAACAVIQRALGEASFSSGLVAELQQMLEEYGSYAPVALTSLEPVRQGEYVEIGDKWTSSDICTDVNGEKYDSDHMIYPKDAGFSMPADTPNDESDCTVTYALNYRYSTLTGTIFRPYGTLSIEDWRDQFGLIRIYGDGVLLYESEEINGSTWEPESFRLDVSGVRELQIMAFGRWAENGGAVGIYSRHPRVCVADLMLQK